MAKSNSVDTSTIDNLVKRAVDYLKQWTRTELDHVISQSSRGNKLPIIVEINQQGYVVGNYGIARLDNEWWRVNYRYSDLEHIFVNKVAAIHYAVYQQTGKWMLAEQILKQDQDVGRFLLKNELYKTRLDQARKRKNQEKTDLFRTRYFESLLKLNQARNHLEKSLRSAKYF